MKRSTLAGLSCVAVFSLALGACGLLDGTSLEGRVKQLNKDAQRLVEQIREETDPDKRSTLQRDLKTVQKNLGELLDDLAREGKKIDVKGFLDDVGKGFEDLGDSLQGAGK